MVNPNSVVIRHKPNQWKVFNDTHRFIVLVAGRRFGKTYLAISKLIQTATTRPDSISWYIAPTYKQAKLIAWKILKAHIPEAARQSINETELTIVLKNGAEIALKGADNPDSLRGVGLHLVILDEFADMHPSVWGEIIRPMLATTNGKAIFIGTPKGYNHFYDIFMAAQAHPKSYAAYHFTTMQGGYVPIEEYLDAKGDSTISPREFRQEWEASFENLTGRVCSEFSRLVAPHGNLRNYDYVGGTILMGLDFNVDPMTASYAVRLGAEIQFFAEASIRNSNTQEMIDHTKATFPGKQIIVYPDPAGRSRSTKAPVGQTDYTLLKRAGFQVYDAGRPYNMADKINTVNAMLRNAAGVRRAFFDIVGCPKTIKGMDGLCYKEGTKIPDKGSGLDHYVDNVSYLICGVAPLKGGHAASTQEFRI